MFYMMRGRDLIQLCIYRSARQTSRQKQNKRSLYRECCIHLGFLAYFSGILKVFMLWLCIRFTLLSFSSSPECVVVKSGEKFVSFPTVRACLVGRHVTFDAIECWYNIFDNAELVINDSLSQGHNDKIQNVDIA